MPSIFADKVCGLILGQAVLAALLHRARTGQGQHVGADDPGPSYYADARSRIANSDRLYAAVRAVLVHRSTDYWIEFCVREHIPASRIVTLDELVGSLPIEVHPVVGAYRHIPPAARFSITPQSLRRPAPLIGENTDEVIA